MNIGIIGSGGREHAICKSIKNSQEVKKIYCFPGNAGTAKIAKNIQLNTKNFTSLKNFILKKKIELIYLNKKSNFKN